MTGYAQRSSPDRVLTRPDRPALRIIQRCSLGSPISPVLANLFMHYAFDAWLARTYPGVAFERYADDAIVHCDSRSRARHVLAALDDRMGQVGLRPHPTKTRIVYCKDSNRRGSHEHTSFTFLGYTFRARKARSRHGKFFTNFLPAISKEAQKKVSGQVRRWRLHLRTGHTLDELARKINPIVRGWAQYYGAFYRSALLPLLQRINAYLVRWLRKKYKRLRPFHKALACWQRITRQRPGLFAHWAWTSNAWR
ncbi:reverse transcriptase [Frankia sp. CcI156]|uniref:Reverse transcriptase n=1 Tax=Frankia casuarinae (strain DSM 45818 / CECT 9043 / HFP020203 / CcI3) TaxID=106370 RepID=Q2JEA8_FRACC|nr:MULTISPECIES: group II intron maturase-specific domain-containing protein [Frankia]ABD10384.1 reverse transcriptase [Frankia casuarinae]ONH24493.1 reverse transcriptase [Frankia sp. CcI156]